MKVFWIRHGICSGNLEGRYLGRTQEGLCRRGQERLLRQKAAGFYPAVRYLAVSPMKRCLESAEILYPGLEPVIVPEFRECDFGRFDGKNYEELRGDAAYQAWLDSGGTLPFPEGESRQVFTERCLGGWQRLVTLLTEKTGSLPGSLACVVHGGTIMALLSRMAFPEKSYYAWQVPNGDGYVCVYDEGTQRFTDCKRILSMPEQAGEERA